MSDKLPFCLIIFLISHPKNRSVKYTMFPSIPSHPQIFNFPYSTIFHYLPLSSRIIEQKMAVFHRFFTVFSDAENGEKVEEKMNWTIPEKSKKKEDKNKKTGDEYWKKWEQTGRDMGPTTASLTLQKDPRKYDEETRNNPQKNQLYGTSYTINLLFPTIVSFEKIILIDSPILSSSISPLPMCCFILQTSRNPCICWVCRLFQREEKRSNKTRKGTRRTKRTGRKSVTRQGTI